MADLFREIDEDLRHERYQKLWLRYRKFVIGAVIALVVGIGAYEAWKARQLDRQHALALGLEQFLSSQDGARAGLQAFALEADRGYGLIAALNAASRFEQGSAERQAMLEQVASGVYGDDYQSLVELLSAYDQGDRVAIERHLVAGSPWREVALGLAMEQAMAAGETARVIELADLLIELRPSGPLARLALELKLALE
ncbi:MAG: hypothetical protein AAF418_07460 [Pseudomonadota bacterium]